MSDVQTLPPSPGTALPPDPAAAAASAPGAPAQPDVPAQTPRQRYADWPVKGDTRPQPWDLDGVGIAKSDRELADGAPNTITPIVISHSYPILMTGTQGAAVTELASRLHILGYDTDISRAENRYGVLTQDVMGAVDKFRTDYGVQEDPTGYGGNTEQTRKRASETVGPFTWEALLRVSDRELQTL